MGRGLKGGAIKALFGSEHLAFAASVFRNGASPRGDQYMATLPFEGVGLPEYSRFVRDLRGEILSSSLLKDGDVSTVADLYAAPGFSAKVDDGRDEPGGGQAFHDTRPLVAEALEKAKAPRTLYDNPPPRFVAIAEALFRCVEARIPRVVSGITMKHNSSSSFPFEAKGVAAKMYAFELLREKDVLSRVTSMAEAFARGGPAEPLVRYFDHLAVSFVFGVGERVRVLGVTDPERDKIGGVKDKAVVRVVSAPGGIAQHEWVTPNALEPIEGTGALMIRSGTRAVQPISNGLQLHAVGAAAVRHAFEDFPTWDFTKLDEGLRLAGRYSISDMSRSEAVTPPVIDDMRAAMYLRSMGPLAYFLYHAARVSPSVNWYKGRVVFTSDPFKSIDARMAGATHLSRTPSGVHSTPEDSKDKTYLAAIDAFDQLGWDGAGPVKPGQPTLIDRLRQWAVAHVGISPDSWEDFHAAVLDWKLPLFMCGGGDNLVVLVKKAALVGVPGDHTGLLRALHAALSVYLGHVRMPLGADPRYLGLKLQGELCETRLGLEECNSITGEMDGATLLHGRVFAERSPMVRVAPGTAAMVVHDNIMTARYGPSFIQMIEDVSRSHFGMGLFTKWRQVAQGEASRGLDPTIDDITGLHYGKLDLADVPIATLDYHLSTVTPHLERDLALGAETTLPDHYPSLWETRGLVPLVLEKYFNRPPRRQKRRS